MKHRKNETIALIIEAAKAVALVAVIILLVISIIRMF